MSTESKVEPGTENPVCDDTGRDLLARVPEADEGGAESDDLSREAKDLAPHAAVFGASFLAGSWMTGSGPLTCGVLASVSAVSGSWAIWATPGGGTTTGASCCAGGFVDA